MTEEIAKIERTEVKTEAPAKQAEDRFESMELHEVEALDGLAREREIKDRYREAFYQYCLDNEIDPTQKGIELPEELKKAMDAEIKALEGEYTIDGVCFLYCQFYKIIEAIKSGEVVEVEAFGPYLRDYLDYIFEEDTTGVKFTKADEVGLAILEYLLTEVIPEAHLVSLFDEYNLWRAASNVLGSRVDQNSHKSHEWGRVENESSKLKLGFRDFVERVLRQRGLIEEDEVEGPENDFVLLSESSKVEDAKKLVKILQAQGNLEGDPDDENSELYFVTNIQSCEDIRYLRVKLRDNEGHWECPALDASGFIADSNGRRQDRFRNENITHLLCLDRNIFQDEQNQVWEMLHSLKDKDGKDLFSALKIHLVLVDTTNPNVTAGSAVGSFKKHLGLN